MYFTKPSPSVSQEPAICGGEGWSGDQPGKNSNVFHKVINRCTGGGKGDNVVDAVYGSDVYGVGDCYLPYKTITHTVATRGNFAILVMPGVYGAANGETTPIVPSRELLLDGYREGGAGYGEFFHGNGCFPVEVDAEIQAGGTTSVRGLKIVVPPGGTGISTVSGYEADINSNTIIGGAIGIDLADGSIEPVTDTIITGAGIGMRAFSVDADAVSISPPQVNTCVFTGNGVGMLLTGADVTVIGSSTKMLNNTFSCNTTADLEVDGSMLDEGPITVVVEGDAFDDVPPSDSLVCAAGVDVCSSSANVGFDTTNTDLASNACSATP